MECGRSVLRDCINGQQNTEIIENAYYDVTSASSKTTGTACFGLLVHKWNNRVIDVRKIWIFWRNPSYPMQWIFLSGTKSAPNTLGSWHDLKNYSIVRV